MKTLSSICGRVSGFFFLIVIVLIPIKLDDLYPEDQEFYK
jgi:hypothetical protein